MKAKVSGNILRDVRSVDAQVYTYLFGPVLSVRRGRFTAFVHGLVGGARINEDVSTPFFPNTAFFARGKFHQNAFAADGGAGLDWNIRRHVALRLFQGDYLYTQFNDFHNDPKNTTRGSAASDFLFGIPNP